MQPTDVLIGHLLDDETLTLDELARACSVRPDWVVEHVQAGLFSDGSVAVSAQREGLLPISQHSLFPLASLSYHDYEGVALNPDEKARLVADLGGTSLMMLRNHGLLTLGHSAADTFLKMFMLQRACEIQIAAQAGGGELIRIPAPILAGVRAAGEKVLRGSGAELAWPGLLRRLARQNPGHDA